MKVRLIAAALLTLTSTLSAQSFDVRKYRTVDLTHALNSKTLYWPTSPTSFKLDQLSFGPTPGGWFYAANTFSAPEHGGTHLDAPIHFGEGHLTDGRGLSVADHAGQVSLPERLGYEHRRD